MTSATGIMTAATTTTSHSHTYSESLTPPRRSSSLHKAMIARLRPMPFQYIWTAWHSKPESQPPAPPATTTTITRSMTRLSTSTSEYKSNLTQLIDQVPDIATFYRIFNNVPWSSIRARESIHFFRQGVKPLWEDDENRNGGCLVIKIRRNAATGATTREDGRAECKADRAVRIWEEVCLMACGGQLQASVTQEHDHILGISYSPRLYWVHISIWTKQGSNQHSVKLLTNTLLSGLSPDLRPSSTTGEEYYYKKHSQHDGWTDIIRKQ